MTLEQALEIWKILKGKVISPYEKFIQKLGIRAATFIIGIFLFLFILYFLKLPLFEDLLLCLFRKNIKIRLNIFSFSMLAD